MRENPIFGVLYITTDSASPSYARRPLPRVRIQSNRLQFPHRSNESRTMTRITIESIDFFAISYQGERFELKIFFFLSLIVSDARNAISDSLFWGIIFSNNYIFFKAINSITHSYLTYKQDINNNSGNNMIH